MKTGGPAFPRPYSEDDYGDFPRPCADQSGMTLRDYFAGQAVVGLLAQSYDPTDAACLAIKVADIMIAERDK